jgi:hypothetical protein
MYKNLVRAPERIDTYGEIAVTYCEDIEKYYNSLSSVEREFAYYMWRASLSGNSIYADQLHRDSRELISLFEYLHDNQKRLYKLQDNFFLKKIGIDQFGADVDTFLVYLWANHGQYFLREHQNSKRTPKKLGLKTLNKQNLINVLSFLRYPNVEKTVWGLERTLFDENAESTLCVKNNIEQSAINIYAPGFTTEDYNSFAFDQQSKINAYFYIDTNNGGRVPKLSVYSAKDKYARELQTSIHWLKKAYEHAKKYPEHFDVHLANSIDLMIQFLQTGDEELFKQHSIEWLQSSSRIDYNFGFIETYEDPKSKRGFFQAEATIKSVDIEKLNKKLPSIEKELPLDDTFKREKMDSLPNASINTKVFGCGALGPMQIVSAYCLPNYSEIRSGYGSKQIIYKVGKSLGTKINPELSLKLSFLKKEADWIAKHDSERELGKALWTTHVILHETIGHGSGRLTQHTFKEGDNFDIDGKKYKIGDTIAVTSDNVSQLLLGYENAIEELRADIVAMYVGAHHISELLACDLMKGWDNILTPEELSQKLIVRRVQDGLRRYINLEDGATKVCGAHARAYGTIVYYLVEHGGLEIAEETVEVDGKEYTVVGLRLTDWEKTKHNIKELMVEVQRIKSTGDGVAAKHLIETYGVPVKHPEYIKIFKANRKAVIGNVKASALMYPDLVPIYENGKIIDVNASWPKDIFEQQKKYAQLALSKV